MRNCYGFDTQARDLIMYWDAYTSSLQGGAASPVMDGNAAEWREL